MLSGHTERVTGVARLGRDRVASSSVDGTLRVWSLETGRVLHELLLPAPVYCLGAAGARERGRERDKDKGWGAGGDSQTTKTTTKTVCIIYGATQTTVQSDEERNDMFCL